MSVFFRLLGESSRCNEVWSIGEERGRGKGRATEIRRREGRGIRERWKFFTLADDQGRWCAHCLCLCPSPDHHGTTARIWHGIYIHCPLSPLLRGDPRKMVGRGRISRKYECLPEFYSTLDRQQEGKKGAVWSKIPWSHSWKEERLPSIFSWRIGPSVMANS